MRAFAFLAGLALGLSGSASASPSQADLVGVYQAEEGPDVAAMIEFLANGKFAYALSAGALDERSQGSWSIEDGAITLATEPKPVPPAFRQVQTAEPSDTFLTVVWPNGDGIAGIDFRIGFETGEPYEGYTQEYGASLPQDETRQPLWVELSEPMHRLSSPRFPIAPGAEAIRFMLEPNDLGFVDLTGATVRLEGQRLILHHPGGALAFRRLDPP